MHYGLSTDLAIWFNLVNTETGEVLDSKYISPYGASVLNDRLFSDNPNTKLCWVKDPAGP
jgi:hypothetical protein